MRGPPAPAVTPTTQASSYLLQIANKILIFSSHCTHPHLPNYLFALSDIYIYIDLYRYVLGLDGGTNLIESINGSIICI